MSASSGGFSGGLAGGYAGDVEAAEAWRLLVEEPGAILLDVRTRAEWAFVGLPDIEATGRPLIAEEWQVFPEGTPNPRFLSEAVAKLEAAGAAAGAPVLCLCRSGQRSAAAAAALTAAGFTRAFNVAGGFEGPLDAHGHRGASGGWKAAGLPWRQT